MKFWCSKCRMKVGLDTFEIAFSHGSRGKRRYAKAVCSCGTKVSVFMKGENNVYANENKKE